MITELIRDNRKIIDRIPRSEIDRHCWTGQEIQGLLVNEVFRQFRSTRKLVIH